MLRHDVLKLPRCGLPGLNGAGQICTGDAIARGMRGPKSDD